MNKSCIKCKYFCYQLDFESNCVKFCMLGQTMLESNLVRTYSCKSWKRNKNWGKK